MRRVIGLVALLLAPVLAGCEKKAVLVAKVDAVYAPTQVLRSDRRLAISQQQTSVGLPEGYMFLVVSTRITNPTRDTQSFDQDGVQIVDEYANRYGRIGLTVDCGEAPSVMEYQGKLDKLSLGPGQSLAGDAQATCFVFLAPAGDRHLSLRIPGAPDAPITLPPARPAPAPAASAAPASDAADPPVSSGIS